MMVKNEIKQAFLQTPDGEVSVELWIESADLMCAQVRMVYAGAEYKGRGRIGSADAQYLANLQKQLPQGVYLKGCVSCRHGNVCPCGAADFEISCTKGSIVRHKGDLIDLMEDWDVWLQRERTFFHRCEDWCLVDAEDYNYLG